MGSTLCINPYCPERNQSTQICTAPIMWTCDSSAAVDLDTLKRLILKGRYSPQPDQRLRCGLPRAVRWDPFARSTTTGEGIGAPARSIGICEWMCPGSVRCISTYSRHHCTHSYAYVLDAKANRQVINYLCCTWIVYIH